MNTFALAPHEVTMAGHADGPLAPIADIFARLLADQGTGGAALAVYRSGRLEADLYGGSYASDSAQLLFSVTKAITAVAAAHAHASGALDLDAPLADCWPEFARPSTSAVTTRMVLGHRSGIASLDEPLTLDQLRSGAGDEAVAAQEPYWEPGTAHGYHSFTYGLLADGVFQRTLGCTVGEYVAVHLREPLGLDLWIGTPDAELTRVHETTVSRQWITPDRRMRMAQLPIPPGTTHYLRQRSELVNEKDFLTASFPAVSGVATARSLARLLAATQGELADGPRVLSSSAREEMKAVRSAGADQVLGISTTFGSGVQRPFPQLPLLGPGSFGHEGANGCLVAADDELGVAVGFITSVFPPVAGASVRVISLLASIRHCLAES